MSEQNLPENQPTTPFTNPSEPSTSTQVADTTAYTQPFSNPNTQTFVDSSTQVYPGTSSTAQAYPGADSATQAYPGTDYTTPGYATQDYTTQGYTAQDYTAQPTQTYTNSVYSQPPVNPYGGQAAVSYTGKGTPSLVMGIISIIMSGTVIVGLVLGIIAAVQGNKALKTDPTDGRAKGGKITGIIGIVLSALALAGLIAFGVFAASIYNDPDVQELIERELSEEFADLDGDYRFDYDINGQTGSISGSFGSSADSPDAADSGNATASTAGSTDTGEEEAVRAAVSAEIDSAVAAVRESAQGAVAAFETENGFALDQLGVVPEEYTDWMLQDLNYSVGTVRVNGDNAMAEVLVNMRDLGTFSDVLEDRVEAWMASEGYGSIGSIDALYEQVGTIMKEAMAATGMHTEDVTLQLSKTDGQWSIDPASQIELTQELFGTDAY